MHCFSTVFKLIQVMQIFAFLLILPECVFPSVLMIPRGHRSKWKLSFKAVGCEVFVSVWRLELNVNTVVRLYIKLHSELL